ncbi:hypothetical protein TPADAL_0118a [Treponema pallidum subsp. pallidum DAL-1]|uniref:Uncharacterized protein n=2 Tax=Treponema pallidum TaxID=160 RepID=A0AAU8RL39_TREPL|nr:hypothetical protein TPESAMD_0118a [Treponema pallidum subsp. pertenue str. SamoaD]AEZ58306.1 hypothetical protein TPECDC2_0118a [Treponema pallidum subsp. pertenue str. CDC2]AEZ59374.1 hypothetical protein TPEGAU_0118a [Treponema pallidum subsp. pertenue str. Gauthier]AEZ60439.1 hypothetical protein TPADAL_0118a [Treponema pallidum subsp. pallidum DAL-1]AGK83762.1 hypothetical protein TPFB_0118a [Treponema pallidum str. Fribourg-Blanc]AJB40137.1 hypothetical protein TENDBA_0118a [Treponema
MALQILLRTLTRGIQRGKTLIREHDRIVNTSPAYVQGTSLPLYPCKDRRPA